MILRSKFESQVEILKEGLQAAGKLVEKAITLATEALVKKDPDLAEQVLEVEKEINQHERDMESLCFKILLQQQPVAKDFRFVSSALKMITDMERIGDQATNIAEICLLLAEEDYITNLDQIAEMGEIAVSMVHNSIQAFVTKDKALARSVIKQDDAIDKLFVSKKDELFDLMIKDPQNSRQAIDLLMIAKYYERIGDHAENIAEWTIYSITGVQKRDAKNKRKAEKKASQENV